MEALDAIHSALRPLTGADDTHPVVDLIGNGEFALGSEASHRTHRYASLASQFDAVIHFDRTTALSSPDTIRKWDAPETQETYPMGV